MDHSTDNNHNNNNHHLTALDIDNQSSDLEDISSASSSSDAAGPLDNKQSSPQHVHHNNDDDIIMQPIHSTSSAPTHHTHNIQTTSKPTNLPLLTACYMSALTTGATTYAFSFYSSALKTSLHLSQNQLDTLSSATFCAGILSWIPGMIVDAWGARSAMAAGGLSNTVNLTLYWIIATERVHLPDIDVLVLVLSLLGVLIFMGCALVTGSVFKAIVESCGPGTKGKAVGCAKGYVGVGSGVYVCLFGALFGSSGPQHLVGPEETSAKLSSIFIQRITFLADDDNTPQNSELKPLNFLLMAAVLSTLAATLPALILLPKQSSSSSASINEYQSRRDGTRSIHFRVVYAGLLSLGMWVVGTSIAELYDEEERAGGSPSGSASTSNNTIINNTFALGSDSIIISDHYYLEDLETDHTTPTSSYARMLLNTTRRLSSVQTHWGSVFFLLLLWWGPALSLLVIPARKESVDESIYDDDNECSAFNYDDEMNDNGDNRIPNNGVGNDEEDEEEEIFLQDDLPLSSSRAKNGDRITNNGDNNAADPTERNFNLMQMLKTCPAWLMAYPCVILVGGGTVMTNNIGQMTESLGFDPATTASSLALFSAAQGASRVCTGIASELALKWELPWFCGCISAGGQGVPRPAFFLLASLVSALSHFVLAVSTSEVAFTLGVTLSGVAFGMVWPMLVLVTGEVFGNRHVGANYMFFDGFSSAAGTLLLSKFVAQEVYDEHITENHGDEGAADGEENFQCIGRGCFAMSHMIVSVLSLTCIVSSYFLIRATRNVYGQM